MAQDQTGMQPAQDVGRQPEAVCPGHTKRNPRPLLGAETAREIDYIHFRRIIKKKGGIIKLQLDKAFVIHIHLLLLSSHANAMPTTTCVQPSACRVSSSWIRLLDTVVNLGYFGRLFRQYLLLLSAFNRM